MLFYIHLYFQICEIYICVIIAKFSDFQIFQIVIISNKLKIHKQREFNCLIFFYMFQIVIISNWPKMRKRRETPWDVWHQTSSQGTTDQPRPQPAWHWPGLKFNSAKVPSDHSVHTYTHWNSWRRELPLPGVIIGCVWYTRKTFSTQTLYCIRDFEQPVILWHKLAELHWQIQRWSAFSWALWKHCQGCSKPEFIMLHAACTGS